MTPRTTLRLLSLVSILTLSAPMAQAAQSTAAPAPAKTAPAAAAPQAQVVTLEARNMRLTEIVAKIREQTGYTIVIDEKHAETALTLKLFRVDPETAARRLARKLALDNYALVVDAAAKTITLRPVGAVAQSKKGVQPAQAQPGEGDGQPQYLDDEALAKMPKPDVDPMDMEIIPPEPGASRGMTQREFEAARDAANANIDPMDQEVLPPSEPGGKGMTQREFEAARAAANPNSDPMDEEIIPPSEPGGKGMTRREFEAARAAANPDADLEEPREAPPANP